MKCIVFISPPHRKSMTTIDRLTAIMDNLQIKRLADETSIEVLKTGTFRVPIKAEPSMQTLEALRLQLHGAVEVRVEDC